ncbi:flagellar hook protein FlgE [Deferrisoma palaeochoriense]
MFRSFYSGVSALRNHQQAMDVIGNNIANVNTPGFKSSRAIFSDTLSHVVQAARKGSQGSGGRNPIQLGLGMTLTAIDRNMGQGALQSTGNNLDLAIEGQGFFVVGQGEDYFYTRSGAFQVDDNFNLVTNAGHRVLGWVDTDNDGLVDPARDELKFINLDRRGDGMITNVVASATPAVSGPNRGDASIGPVTTFPTTVTDEWRIECTDASIGEFTITGARTGELPTKVLVGETFSDPNLGTFVVNGGTPAQASLSLDTNGDGDAIVITAVEYGAGGNDIQVELVKEGPNRSLGVSVSGNKITVSLGTDNLGRVTSTEADVAAAIAAHPEASAMVTAAGGGGGTAEPTATPRFLAGGAGPNEGDYFTITTTAAGGAMLENITVSRDGTIVGIFENGTTEEIARVALGLVPNPQGLLAVGDGLFAESPTSGSGFPPVVPGSEGAGTLASGFLEMSNVDLTREFTDMIVTQRGFQANSRIITTSDEMLQDLLALKR